MAGFGETHDSGESRTEQSPNLDTLRGSNTTLQLYRLIQHSTLFSADAQISPGTTVIQHAISKLQDWAIPIDRKVVQQATATVISTKAGLGLMVSDLMNRGELPSSLDLMTLFRFFPGPMLARQDQWDFIQTLFDTDNGALKSGSTGGLHLPGGSQLARVHDYMFALMEKATKLRGNKLVGPTAEDLPDGGEVRSRSGPTIIEGVSATITVRDRGFMNAWGYPNITGAVLQFEPSFLASVRPLTREQYLKYFPREERTSRQGAGQSKQGSQTGEARRTEGHRNPKDPEGHYQTLGVNPDTDPDDMEEVILAAYRRLARKYHADTGGDTANQQKMVGINLAYEFLKNVSNRRGYGRNP